MRQIDCSLDDLLTLNGEKFVEKLYQVILDREPDQEGREYYLRKLREGVDKRRLIFDIASGAEARLVGANLFGLPDLMRWEGLARNPILRPFLTWFRLVAPDDWFARKLRSISAHLAVPLTKPQDGSAVSRTPNPPNWPDGVEPNDVWGVRLGRRYDANNPDLTWSGFDVPESVGVSFLRWTVAPVATVGFWWPHQERGVELRVDLSTDGVQPLRIRVGSEIVFDHKVDIGSGSIWIERSELSHGFNELSFELDRTLGGSSDSPRLAVGIRAFEFFLLEVG